MALPSITIQSLDAADQTNVPFTLGHVFAPGDMAAGRGLIARAADGSYLPLQVDQKATHADGSVRHAILSGILPALAAGEMQPFQLLDADKRASTQQMASVFSTVELVLGGVDYVAKLDISAESTFWLAGPIVNERRYVVPFVAADLTTQPDLRAYFSVRDYGTAQRIDVTIEHTNAFSLTSDLTYDAKIFSGATVVYERAGITHYTNARWRKVFLTGATPAVHVRHDTAYLIASKAVPNYDQSVVVAEASLKDYAGTPELMPMGRSRFVADMGTTGGRPDIGLMPDVYAAVVLSQDPRAFAAMINMAEAGGSWGTHRRDTKTGRPLNIVEHPKTSILGRESDAWNYTTGLSEWLGRQLTANPLTADSAHQPAFSYLPYLLTGDYFHLEELHFWANFSLYQSNPSYRKDSAGLVTWDQLRGQGWTMRTLGEAAAITPDDHPDKVNFARWLDDNLSYYVATYVDGNANSIGVVTDGYTFSYAGGTALAPWQEDHFTSAIGHVAELGFDKAARLMKWKAKFQIGRMIDPGYCSMDAAIYNLKLKDTWDGVIYPTLAEVYQKSVDPQLYALKCSSAEQLAWRNARRATDEPVPYLAGDIIGYARSTEGFASNYQPALAMCVDSGFAGGPDAWSKFITRPTKPDYSTGVQFNIVPRDSDTVTVPPIQPPQGDKMTYKLFVVLGMVDQDLSVDLPETPASIVNEVRTADGQNVIASVTSGPIEFPGLPEGDMVFFSYGVDANGVAMGVPFQKAFTANASTAQPYTPPASTTRPVPLPGEAVFTLTSEQ